MTSPLQQKLRINGPVIITANRLSDGAVVHRMTDGEWSVDLDDAEVLTTLSEAQAALKAAQADGIRAVGPYVAPVEAKEPSTGPGNLRELIRVSGPTFPLPSDDGWLRPFSDSIRRSPSSAHN